MNLKVRKPFLYMLLATLLIGTTLVSFKYLHAFQLKSVTVAPEYFAETAGELDLPTGENLFSLPVKKAMDDLLNRRHILSVTFDYELPGRVRINLNETRPLALTISDDGRIVYSLDRYGYLYHFDTAKYGFDYPVITGIGKCRIYERAGDSRIKLILAALERLKDDDIDLYLAVSGIDLSKVGYISVYLDGLPFAVLTCAGSLYESIIQTRQFVLGTRPDLENIKKLDLRSDGLIIAVK